MSDPGAATRLVIVRGARDLSLMFSHYSTPDVPAHSPALVVLAALQGPQTGPAALLPSFDTHVRYSGIRWRITGSISGWSCTLLATALYDIKSSSLPITIYLALIRS